MMGQKMDKPCGDCVDGHCTMNCGPRIPPEVRSAYLGSIGNVEMQRTMIPINTEAGAAIMRDEITVREGDRLWSLLSLILDTHMDDLDARRLKELEALIRSWRLTHADGSKITPYPEYGGPQDWPGDENVP
jgi:hypothetical protein